MCACVGFSRCTLLMYFLFYNYSFSFFSPGITPKCSVKDSFEPLSGVSCSSFSLTDEFMSAVFLSFHLEKGSIVLFITERAGAIFLTGARLSSHFRGPLQNTTREGLE